MAEWIAGGEPSMDLWQMDVRRFGAQYRSPSYTLKRVLETYETYYDIHYPFEERQAGRPLRTSPAYEWHRTRDAAFGEKSGWERANWFEPIAVHGDESLRPRGWAGKLWSPAIGVEHRACREAVALCCSPVMVSTASSYRALLARADAAAAAFRARRLEKSNRLGNTIWIPAAQLAR